ncbi:MAG: sulfatase-like hydrolase/transferase [Haloarculaceae archaeon]
MTHTLSELSGADTVENVLVFVSDAHRYDFLPERVSRLGVTARAIAPSTFTASALPSLLTGRYPASHRAWSFDDRLPARPALLSPDDRDVGFDAQTVWIDLASAAKPPLQIHHVEAESTLDEREPPFVQVVHDVGPHAPYGFENDAFESVEAFFQTHEKRRDALVDLYREDCRNSADRFLQRYRRLEERGLLEDTLVVFTADHGQCLGERENGGRFGHGHPLCPETVEIPVVFAGAGLPTGETYRDLAAGVDVAPTALSALGEPVPGDVDGADLWADGVPADRRPRSDVWQFIELAVGGRTLRLDVYGATSAWDETGGYVFRRGLRPLQTGAIAYDNLFRGYGPAWRANATLGSAIELARMAVSGSRSYGSPAFSEQAAREAVPDAFDADGDEETDVDLTTDQEAQLRDLGYLS